MAKVPNG